MLILICGIPEPDDGIGENIVSPTLFSYTDIIKTNVIPDIGWQSGGKECISMDIEDMKEQLFKSPMFNLSLANKELFHSNFLAWLGNNYPKEFIQVVSELVGDINWSLGWNEKWKINRETKHYDLSVQDENGKFRLVLENKFKSVPMLSQLQKYTNSVSKNKHADAVLVLLSFTEDIPDRQQIINLGWTICSYRQLRDALLMITVSNCYHQQIICDYVRFITLLLSFTDLWLNEQSCNSPFLIDVNTDIKCQSTDAEEQIESDNLVDTPNMAGLSELYDIARELRIHDLYGKLRAQKLCEEIKNRLNKRGVTLVDDVAKLNGTNVFVNWGFTNSQPLLEIKMKTNINDDIFIIQVQGVQYRHAIEVFNPVFINAKKLNPQGEQYIGSNYTIGKMIIDLGGKKQKPSNYPSLFSNRPFGQQKPYCQYTSSQSAFVYQWIKITPSDTICDIISAMVEDTMYWNKIL